MFVNVAAAKSNRPSYKLAIACPRCVPKSDHLSKPGIRNKIVRNARSRDDRISPLIAVILTHSLTLSSDFDKFPHLPANLEENLKVPCKEATLSPGIKRDRSPIVLGYRSLGSGFLFESSSTYRRPSPFALSAKRLETRAALWSISIQWNTQYGISPLSPSFSLFLVSRLSRPLYSEWKMVRDEIGGVTPRQRVPNVSPPDGNLYREHCAVSAGSDGLPPRVRISGTLLHRHLYVQTD